MAETIKITQTGSPIRREKDQRATLVGLGLNKMHRTRELEDTPEVRGMIRKVAHMVSVASNALAPPQGVGVRTARSDPGLRPGLQSSRISATKAKASARHETERNPRQSGRA